MSFHTIINGFRHLGTIGEGEPCLMLRSDIDGLPMAEESGEEFASTNGNMHACGSDRGYLVGAAHILKAHESELKGTVKLFQPGEEGYNGSDEAIAEGVLESPHVDRAFAMHVVSTVPTGVIVYGERPMAAAYNWKIVVKGELPATDPCPTHASTPSPPPPIFISDFRKFSPARFLPVSELNYLRRIQRRRRRQRDSTVGYDARDYSRVR